MTHSQSLIGCHLLGRRIFRTTVFSLLLLGTIVSPCSSTARAAEKSKVRTITAFIRLDHVHFQEQVEDALVFLRKARIDYQRAGYEVQTIRISTQPFREYIQGLSREEALAFFRDFDRLATEEGFAAAIGPAMHSATDDASQAELLAEILRTTDSLNASLTVADEHGIRWNAVREAAKIIRHLADHSPDGLGNFHFAAAALVPPNTPFYPASYQGGAERQFGVGLQSANVVAEAFGSSANPNGAQDALEAMLGEHAGTIETIARRVESETGWQYAGLDLSPAPMGAESIGGAIEALAGTEFGTSGTMTAAAVVTNVLQALPVKRAGYSGLMIPVLEDEVLAERWSEGTLTLQALLAYSAVCAAGLDTVPLPGNATLEQLVRIIGDVASLAVKLDKPLSVRLMPVPGKKAGERTEFDDPFIVNVTLQPIR